MFRGYSPVSPRFVELLLTYKCNLSCEFCYQAREKRETFPDMKIEDAKVIEENIRKSFYFKPRIHLFGGEPSVNKDFMKILRYFSNKGYKVSLTTNGVDIDKFIQGLAMTRNLVEINMSLNTENREKSLSTLQLFKTHQQKRKIRVNLACPINVMNQMSLVEIVRQFEDSYASCITFQHTTFSSHYKEDMDFEAIKNQIQEITRTPHKVPVLFLPNIKCRDIANYYSDSKFPYNKNKCIFPWFVLFIQPNSDVIPCDEVDVTIDNAKNNSLKDIWNNDNYRKFRQNIQRQGVSYPICKRCCHRQYY